MPSLSCEVLTIRWRQTDMIITLSDDLRRHVLTLRGRLRSLWIYLLVKIHYFCNFFFLHKHSVSISCWSCSSLWRTSPKKGGHCIHQKFCPPWNFQLLTNFSFFALILVVSSPFISFFGHAFLVSTQKLLGCWGAVLCFGWDRSFSLLFIDSRKNR